MLSLVATQRQKMSTYAITILTHQRHRLFQRTETAGLMIATLFRYRDQGKFALHAFAVMPDHIHALITPGHRPEHCPLRPAHRPGFQESPCLQATPRLPGSP
jgi:REP element-mobilizing transposase RayT